MKKKNDFQTVTIVNPSANHLIVYNTVQYIQYIGKDNCDILIKFNVIYFL